MVAGRVSVRSRARGLRFEQHRPGRRRHEPDLWCSRLDVQVDEPWAGSASISRARSARSPARPPYAQTPTCATIFRRPPTDSAICTAVAPDAVRTRRIHATAPPRAPITVVPQTSPRRRHHSRSGAHDIRYRSEVTKLRSKSSWASRWPGAQRSYAGKPGLIRRRYRPGSRRGAGGRPPRASRRSPVVCANVAPSCIQRLPQKSWQRGEPPGDSHAPGGFPLEVMFSPTR